MTSSRVIQNNRSRSLTSSPSRRATTKRALTNTACSPRKYDIEAPRKGKRRKHHNLKDLPLDGPVTATTCFPSTSFEFDLHPRKARRMSLAAERYEEHDLTSLRANAFWELRRSVAENGEGLVQRMRDYEHSRSESYAYYKITRAQELDCKQESPAGSSCPSSPPYYTSDGEEDDDDDEVQIFADDEPRIYHRTRSVSLDGGRRYSYTDEKGDKAVAELGLALATGAVGITDYRPVLSVQTTSEFQVGEMWK